MAIFNVSVGSITSIEPYAEHLVCEAQDVIVKIMIINNIFFIYINMLRFHKLPIP